MNRKTNKQTSKRNKRSRRDPIEANSQDTLSPAINLSRFLKTPPRMIVKLRWQGGGVLAAAGSGTASKPFNANGVYDVDPAVGGAAANGFAEWMTLYGVYRVLHVRAHVQFANREAFPVRCATGFFPSVNSAFPATEWGNTFCREHNVLGPLTGKGVTTATHAMDIDKLFDVNAVRGDLPNFYGTSASNPTTLGNFCIGVNSMGGADLLVNGVNYGITLDYTMELSFPITLAPTLVHQPILGYIARHKEENDRLEKLSSCTAEELLQQLLTLKK